MGDFRVVPLLHSASDVCVMYRYELAGIKWLREHVTKAKLATKFFGEGGFFPFIYTADTFADNIYGITSTDNVWHEGHNFDIWCTMHDERMNSTRISNLHAQFSFLRRVVVVIVYKILHATSTVQLDANWLQYASTPSRWHSHEPKRVGGKRIVHVSWKFFWNSYEGHNLALFSRIYVLVFLS